MLSFDLPVMIAVAVACLPIFFTGNLIARWEGALFLGYYVAYTAYLVLAAQRHDALARYGLVMTTVVLPLTVVTLLVVAWREWRARLATAKQAAAARTDTPAPCGPAAAATGDSPRPDHAPAARLRGCCRWRCSPPWWRRWPACRCRGSFAGRLGAVAGASIWRSTSMGWPAQMLLLIAASAPWCSSMPPAISPARRAAAVRCCCCRCSCWR